MENAAAIPINCPEPRDTSNLWNNILHQDLNPLLTLDFTNNVGTTPSNTGKNLIEFDTLLKSFTDDLYLLQHYVWQRLHLEACQHFRVIPRGMRVFCMPTYGESHPALLKQWQDLNIGLGFNYIKLLLQYFSPLESELRTKVETMYNDLTERFVSDFCRNKLHTVCIQVSAYTNRLKIIKQRKLARDYNDFSRGQVFVWPRSQEIPGPIHESNNDHNRTDQVPLTLYTGGHKRRYAHLS